MLYKSLLKYAAAAVLILSWLFPPAAFPAMKTAVITVPGCAT